MGQPDTFPGDDPREEPQRRALHHRYEDPRALPFPRGDWGEPARRLEEVYRWAEAGALGSREWYLRDRVRKRRGARALRLAAVCLAAAGIALPLASAAAGDGPTVWGYVVLLGAAVCLGLDRVLGLTAGWMRDVATAQAIERRLDALRFDWAAERVREVLGPAEGTAGEAAERCLSLLRRFCEDVTDLVRVETADWMAQFGAGAGPLRTQSAPAAGHAPAHSYRLPHPSARPSMPRQRPPESPR